MGNFKPSNFNLEISKKLIEKQRCSRFILYGMQIYHEREETCLKHVRVKIFCAKNSGCGGINYFSSENVECQISGDQTGSFFSLPQVYCRLVKKRKESVKALPY